MTSTCQMSVAQRSSDWLHKCWCLHLNKYYKYESNCTMVLNLLLGGIRQIFKITAGIYRLRIHNIHVHIIIPFARLLVFISPVIKCMVVKLLFHVAPKIVSAWQKKKSWIIGLPNFVAHDAKIYIIYYMHESGPKWEGFRGRKHLTLLI